MLLQAKQITKSFGAHEVFAPLDLQINEQDRIGLIGANGAGKSTLLQVLTGELSADQGQVQQSRQARIAYLKQAMNTEANRTIWEEVQLAFQPLLIMEQELRQLEQQMSHRADEKLLNRYASLETHFAERGGYQYETTIRSALNGLGLGSLDWKRQTIAELSGGQKTRTSLARQLLEKPDLLILDEPTNYLDLDALAWLEQMLSQYEQAFLIVSHDRYFLDRLIKQTWELDHGKLTRYSGNYTAYLALKEAAIDQQEKNWQKQQKERKHHEAFIERNIARASTTKRAQSRRKTLERMDTIERPQRYMQQAAIRFDIAQTSGRIVVSANQLCCGYAQPLTKPLSFEIERGARIALLGTNGVGKSTLLHTLAGKIPALHGTFTLGHQVELDLYDQEQQDLTPQNRLLDEIWNAHPQLEEAIVRSYLGQFLFSQDDVFQRVDSLSGGEKARLSLLKRLLSQANFLLLDEPTNHLDLVSKERLEEALIQYPGTLLFVSHDRYLISRIANQIWELSPQGLTSYDGDYHGYLEQKTQQKKEQADHTKKQHKRKSLPDQKQKTEQQIAAIEREIAILEEQIVYIEQQLCLPEVYKDIEKLRVFEQQLAQTKQRLEEQTEQWLLLTD